MSNEKSSEKPKIGGIGRQANQYRTIGGTSKPPEQQDSQMPQNNNTTLQKNDIVIKHQNDNTVKQQNRTKTQEREKVTYYLDSPQIDKLEQLRIDYKKATGTRINDQELMRLIVDRLYLDFLL